MDDEERWPEHPFQFWAAISALPEELGARVPDAFAYYRAFSRWNANG